MKEVEVLIIHGFPKKIDELNKLLATPIFCSREFSDFHQDLNTPVPDPVLVDNNYSVDADKQAGNGTQSPLFSVVRVMHGHCKAKSPVMRPYVKRLILLNL
uniref:Proteasome activator PA28 N-terminal domain-containing protein n=1 Tax=Glossina brevipalpis TaxID=37001 RepID=A0A1A9W9B8_9MUSC